MEPIIRRKEKKFKHNYLLLVTQMAQVMSISRAIMISFTALHKHTEHINWAGRKLKHTCVGTLKVIELFCDNIV